MDTAYLTGIRGFAVLIVLLGHISNTGGHFIPGLDLRATAKGGVWLFFLLSAYLLTLKLMEDIDQRGFVFSLWRYAVRRLLRIMPAYLVFLGGLWSFSLMEAKVAVDHALLLRGDDHLWTIPVEMKFYFVLPIVVGMLLTLPCRPVVAAAIAVGSLAVYYLAGPDRISENSTELSHYLPFFAAGTVLALVPEFRGQQVLGWLGIAAFFVLTPRAIAWVFDISVSQALEWSWLFALSWGAVILGSRTGSLNVVFSLRPLLFLGEISFSLYLLHYFVIRQLPPMQV